MNALDRAMQLRSSINIGQPKPQMPKKSIGGGLSSALGGAGTGAALATAIPAAAGFGVPLAIGGALLGGAEYFFS